MSQPSNFADTIATALGLALKDQTYLDNPIILAVERYIRSIVTNLTFKIKISIK